MNARVDRRQQPVPLVVEANHCLVQRNVIRVLVAFRLQIGFPHPVVNSAPTVVDTEALKNRDSIRES